MASSVARGKAANRAPRLRAGVLDRPVDAFGDGPGDGEGAALELEVGPPQRHQLAPACARHRRQHQEHGERLVVLLCPLEQGQDRLGGARVDLGDLPRPR